MINYGKLGIIYYNLQKHLDKVISLINYSKKNQREDVYSDQIDIGNGKNSIKNTDMNKKETCQDQRYITNLVCNIPTEGKSLATGYYDIYTEEFTVLEGSRIRKEPAPNFYNDETHDSNRRLREKLINNGIINEQFYFMEDYTFKKPSPAATIIKGTSSNGKVEWYDKDTGETLKDIKEELRLF